MLKQEEQQLPFQIQYNPEQRKKKCDFLLEKYPEHIPIIFVYKKYQMLQRVLGAIDLVELKKNQFCVHKNTQLKNLLAKVKESLKVHKNEGVFFFCNNQVLCHGFTYNKILDGIKIEELYKQNKQNDGYLYIIYTGPDPFGK